MRNTRVDSERRSQDWKASEPKEPIVRAKESNGRYPGNDFVRDLALLVRFPSTGEDRLNLT